VILIEAVGIATGEPINFGKMVNDTLPKAIEAVPVGVPIQTAPAESTNRVSALRVELWNPAATYSLQIPL
jgi:hypothetical protein